jgi:ubiquinone/menaquinone biosynthesis C-methylase UbiE
MNTTTRRRRLVPEMEGFSARWYAKNRGTPSQLAQWRRQAAQVTAGLPGAAAVLEVAPGPGYFAVELARLGYAVTAVDVSRTMVEISRETAARAEVEVDVRHGDASRLPFPDASFDLVVCQAAFKNFTDPVRSLDEMHRVLRPGRSAVIHDLASQATTADIAAEVAGMGIRGPGAFFTRQALRWLRHRAVTADEFAEMARRSAFGTASIQRAGIGLEVRLVHH